MTSILRKIYKTVLHWYQMLEFRRQMKRAAKDPVFLADMEQTMEDFKYVDAETERRIDS
jgi:hypothetical protein